MSTPDQPPDFPPGICRNPSVRPNLGNFLAILASLCACLWFGPAPLEAAGVVSGCNQQDLENAIAGGGSVTFAQDCEITLTNTIRFVLTTQLDASGHNVSIRSLLNSAQATFTNITATTNIVSTPIGTNCQTTITCVTNLGSPTCDTNTTCTTNYSF